MVTFLQDIAFLHLQLSLWYWGDLVAYFQRHKMEEISFKEISLLMYPLPVLIHDTVKGQVDCLILWSSMNMNSIGRRFKIPRFIGLYLGFLSNDFDVNTVRFGMFVGKPWPMIVIHRISSAKEKATTTVSADWILILKIVQSIISRSSAYSNELKSVTSWSWVTNTLIFVLSPSLVQKCFTMWWTQSLLDIGKASY